MVLSSGNISSRSWKVAIGGMLIAAMLGCGVAARLGLVEIAVGLVVGLLLLVLMLRFPALSVMLLWGGYVIKSTIFANVSLTQGVYYPLYLVMGFNAARLVVTKRSKGLQSVIAWIYGLFYLLVVAGLLWGPSILGSDEVAQRLFVYLLAPLTALQLTSDSDQNHAMVAITATALVLAVWTVVGASTTEFAYRSGVQVNQNFIANTIGLGLIPIVSKVLQGRKNSTTKAYIAQCVALCIGVYAILLLASRGSSLAFVGAVAFLLLRRISRERKRVFILVFILAIGSALFSTLPGVNGLFDRLTYQVESLNGRLPLWEAGFEQVRNSSLGHLILGGGMGTSELVSYRVSGQGSIHNVFLQILVDNGIVGLACFVGLIVTTLRNLLVSDNEGNAQSVAVVVFLSIAACSGTFANNHIFWIALGLTWWISGKGSRIVESSAELAN